MTVESEISEQGGGETPFSGGGRMLLGAGSSGATKRLDVIGFNVTGNTKTIDGETYKVIEAYVSPNWNLIGWVLYWVAGPSIIDLITNPIHPIQDEPENVSPFTDHNGTVYENAYKTMIYVPATWSNGFFQAKAEEEAAPEVGVDSYERSGIQYTRRGSTGKNAYYVSDIDLTNNAFMQKSTPTNVTAGRLLLGSGGSLATPTNVTLTAASEAINNVNNETHFRNDVYLLGNAYVGDEKEESEKVAKKGDIPDVAEPSEDEEDSGKAADAKATGDRLAALEARGYLMKDENGVYAIFP